jgi:hypothetical protein
MIRYLIITLSALVTISGCQTKQSESPVNSAPALSFEEELVAKACMGYLEGFYEGDTVKIQQNLHPDLHKFGFWRGEDGAYELDSYMTFEQAVGYARYVTEREEYPDSDAPMEVEVLDIMNHIASAKVTAWWGVDYLLLSKRDGSWKIEQVIWEGPL